MPSTVLYENPDLKRERQHCSFDKEEVTNLFDGSPQKTKNRRELENYILSDPELKDPVPIEYLSHADKYAAELRKACLFDQKIRRAVSDGKDFLKGNTMMMGHEVTLAVLREGNPLGLHFGMFLPALMGQGSEEQQAEWLPKAIGMKIIGTYAQTEMGHGTFLRGLETKATYDPQSKEFVLETPSISAYKWWPGGLGQTANYAVVMAQLYTKGRAEGPHPFLVQLRDTETHHPLPGVIIGEIGPKLGLNSVNNGYLAFDRVRIPRNQMLMKNSQVLEDGTYVKPKNSKLSYGTMVFVRVMIAGDMVKALAKATTIATRYSCVRHQSELEPGAPEPQIIEYQAQQNKLFPPIAATFAFHFASSYLWTLYNKTTKNKDQVDLQMLPDLHGLSCALKALTSTEAANFVETLRQSCGGHGYMACSNFPRIYALFTASETYEGENTVLWLQVARYLVKTYNEKSGGPSVRYLIEPQQVMKSDSSLEGILNLFRIVSTRLVEQAVGELDKLNRQGVAFHNAWNSASIHLLKAAQAHSRFFIADRFVNAIKEGQFTDPVRKILVQLCELFLIYWLMDRNGDFVLFAGLTREQLSAFQSKYADLLAAIRPQALNIVDSFDIRDEILNSPLGCWDGNVYQRLFDEAQKSPLNKTPVHQESFTKYLKPLMQSKI